MTAPKRIQMTRQRPWRADNPDAVRVDRNGKWGNPFPVGAHIGQKWDHGAEVEWVDVRDRAHAVELFARWVESDWYGARRIRSDLHELRGHDLACWCPLDAPCHADVLLELANAPASRPTGEKNTG